MKVFDIVVRELLLMVSCVVDNKTRCRRYSEGERVKRWCENSGSMSGVYTHAGENFAGISVSSFAGYLRDKNAYMIFGRHMCIFNCVE